MGMSWRAKFVRRAASTVVADMEQPLEVRRVKAERRKVLPLPRKVIYEQSDLGGVQCVVARPRDTLPLRHIVYMHGGGYTVGLWHVYHVFCGLLARSATTTVLAVDYRLAPEHPCPGRCRRLSGGISSPDRPG